jgi:TonB family protein
MTHWLMNLVAFSAQLAVLVGAGAIVMAALRVDAPRASLRFWQTLFVSALLWPLYQLWEGPTVAAPIARPLSWTVLAPSPNGGLVAPTLDERITTVVVTIVAVGVLIRLGWLAIGLIKLRWIAASAESAAVLASVAAPLQRALGTAADVRFSDAVPSPATIGFRRPVVLLPCCVRELPPAVQRAVLCHELLHVRQHDWIATLIEEVWCACMWFHPAARLLASRLGLAREMVVDEATIALTGDRRAYAGALLGFSTAHPRPLAATALIGRRHLEQRIARIAQEVSMPRSALALRLSLAAGIVVMATLAASSALPVNAATPAQSDKVYVPNRDGDLTLPIVETEVKPTYTAAAMQAKIEGSIFMSVVVLASGRVGDVTVIKSLDQEHGLDQQAVDAARQWTFKPGTKDGQAVNVEVTLEMTFTLRK